MKLIVLLTHLLRLPAKSFVAINLKSLKELRKRLKIWSVNYADAVQPFLDLKSVKKPLLPNGHASISSVLCSTVEFVAPVFAAQYCVIMSGL